ncbi:low temperature requirement protein A [Rhizobium sp.]|uniref:low temperature requirement protein A n=1 Tax=Rhizobium sp. TaxID=391 RepID=UPI0034C64827
MLDEERAHRCRGRWYCRKWRPTGCGSPVFRLEQRDRNEAHRGSSSLELMFDLATVVAVSAAAHGYAQQAESGNFLLGTVSFLCSFFMAWLAWMNYTWFASAYDDQSTSFRALSMIIMFGSLTLAAGIQGVFVDQPIWLAMIGFSIMRLAMMVLWFGAANGDRDQRSMALYYAAGIGALQIYWNVLIVILSPHEPLYPPFFGLGAVGELLLPVLVQSRSQTNWHHGHIVDRYNSFNIIVLGECFASVVSIISGASAPDPSHFWLAVLCSVIAFSMWRLYFDRNRQLLDRSLGTVLLWSYDHYPLFAAGAATAAGFVIFETGIGRDSEISPHVATLFVAVPIAIYLVSLWLVRDRLIAKGACRWLLVIAGGAVLVGSAIVVRPLELIAAVLVATVLARARLLQPDPGTNR